MFVYLTMYQKGEASVSYHKVYISAIGFEFNYANVFSLIGVLHVGFKDLVQIYLNLDCVCVYVCARARVCM